MPVEILGALELFMVEAIGMTAVAIASVTAGKLTLAQWRALVVLGRTDGLRVGDVAQAVGMSLPSASRLIRRLERRGFATTVRDPSDRRATLVRLTPKGTAIRQDVIDCRREMMEAALQLYAPHLPTRLAPGLAAIATALAQYK